MAKKGAAKGKGKGKKEKVYGPSAVLKPVLIGVFALLLVNIVLTFVLG